MAEEPTQDPFPNGGPADGVVVYGGKTSRVVKVLWVCAELRVKAYHLPVMQQRSAAWFAAINPKKQVPAFKDGTLTLHESNTICHYLASKYGPETRAPDGTVSASNGGILPLTHEASAIASMWTEFAETTIAPAQNPVFFGLVRKGPVGCAASPTGEKLPGCPSDEQLRAHVLKLQQAWSIFNEALAGKDYVTGDRFTLGDVCAAVQANRLIRNNGFGCPELALDGFPHVVSWFSRVSARPAFQEQVAPYYS
ncbi:hypothetical protein AB1Y20_002415 [Prymnesium parvum]|uniref:Glutathione transferase n=1 Tax=Prymnesium parvum TaxID=97485 RepID=A0AB34JB97_PRYPA